MAEPEEEGGAEAPTVDPWSVQGKVDYGKLIQQVRPPDPPPAPDPPPPPGPGAPLRLAARAARRPGGSWEDTLQMHMHTSALVGVRLAATSC